MSVVRGGANRSKTVSCIDSWVGGGVVGCGEGQVGGGVGVIWEDGWCGAG